MLFRSPEVGPYVDRMMKDRDFEFLVLAANIEEGTQVLRQIRARKVTVPILGGDGLDGIEDAGSFSDGVYVSTAYLPTLNTEANRKLLEAYRQKFPLGNPLDYSAAATYDIVYLLKGALARAGTDHRALRDAVAAIGRTQPPFTGVTGSIAFDENGDVPNLDILMGVVRNGTIRPVEEQ